MPRVALCVLASEGDAPFIDYALDAHAARFSECVVALPAIEHCAAERARASGAAVVWVDEDDDAIAVERAVAATTSEWILILFADDALDADQRNLASLDEHAEAFALVVRRYSYRVETDFHLVDPRAQEVRGALGYRLTSEVRLFRRHAAHRFRARGELDAATPGITVARLDLVVHAYADLRRRRGARALRFVETTATPSNSRELCEHVKVLLSAGELMAGIRAIEGASSLDRTKDVLYLEARLELALGFPDRALAALERCVASDERWPDAWSLLGDAASALGHTARAEAAYRQALAIEPRCPAAQNNLADLLARVGRAAEALPIARSLTASLPGLPQAWSTLGVVLARLGELGAARHAFANALDIEPGRLAARHNLARIGTASPRPVPRWPRGRVRIFVCGSLDPGAFPRRFFEYLPDIDGLGASVFVAGSGARKVELEIEARARTRHVRFLGHVDRNALDGWLRTADVGVHLTELGDAPAAEAVQRMIAADLPVIENQADGGGFRSEAEVRELLARAIARARRRNRSRVQRTGRKAEPPRRANPIEAALALLAAGRLREGFRAYERRFELDRVLLHTDAPTTPRWRGEPLCGRRLLVNWRAGAGRHAPVRPLRDARGEARRARRHSSLSTSRRIARGNPGNRPGALVRPSPSRPRHLGARHELAVAVRHGG